MTGTTIDFVILGFIGFSFILGYRYGFIDRALSLVASIFIIFISWSLSATLAPFFNIYRESGLANQALVLVTPVISRIIAFVCIFVALTLIKFVLFLIIKPLIRTLKESFSLLHVTDSVLGGIFNTFKSLIIVYICLLFVCLPFVKNGNQAVLDSHLGSLVLNAAPTVSAKMMGFGHSIEKMLKDTTGLDGNLNAIDCIELLDTARQMGVVDENQMQDFVQYYQPKFASMADMSVSNETYQDYREMLEQLPITDSYKQELLSKLIVE